MKLPKVLYARMEKDGEDAYVVAHEKLFDCVEDDGDKTVVGTYWLKETHSYTKVVSTVEP